MTSNEVQDRTEIEAIPQQYQIVVERFHETVCIHERGAPDGQQSVCIVGKSNIDLLIDSLQKVRAAL